jgi:hypothetical protein
MKLEFSGQIVEKYSNNEANENPSSRCRAVPCGQTDGRTDMTKLTASFRKFSKSPVKNKNSAQRILHVLGTLWNLNLEISVDETKR